MGQLVRVTSAKARYKASLDSVFGGIYYQRTWIQGSIEYWGHSCNLSTPGALRVKSQSYSVTWMDVSDSTIRVVELAFSTKQEERNQTPTGVGGKCPEKEKATHQHGTCGRGRVGGMARDGNEEHIRAKQNHQGW